MSIWKPTPASQEPVTFMLYWQVYEVPYPSGATRHFVGYCGEGRVSSPIQEWNAEEHYGTTRSGRRYMLIGESRWNKHAQYVLGRWLVINKVDPNAIRDVSDEYTGGEYPQQEYSAEIVDPNNFKDDF